jgi:transcriptional regulator with XRE-family HTH domain
MTPTGLKRIRRALGLTQERLARALGVDRVTVARWEGGTYRITEPIVRLVQRIAAEARGTRKRKEGRAR